MVEQDLAAGAEVVSVDLAVIGWSRPAAAARLVMAMAHEIALTEHRSTRAEPDLRATLTAIMTTPAPGTESIDDPTSSGGCGR